MALGLKRGHVELVDYDPEWANIAKKTIDKLLDIFGLLVRNIQHVGSTAIKDIKAKPIIDIAVAVADLMLIDQVESQLNEAGFFRSNSQTFEEDMIFCDYNERDDSRSFHIHIVKFNSLQWYNYIRFRDYLNLRPDLAKEYEDLKIDLAKKFPNDRLSYTAGKEKMIKSLLEEANIQAIAIFKDLIKLEIINKGWSGDKKYCITIKNGTRYLLRISPASKYESRKELFDMLKKISALSIPMCKPIDFGTNESGVYMVQSWIEGRDLEDMLFDLPYADQYELGFLSGKLLKRIHSIQAPDSIEDWESRFNKKTDYKIEKYRECGLRFQGDEYILEYINKNRDLLKGRPQSFQHGDYHVGNMMLENGELRIIDFDRFDFGDPWEEFNRIVWTAAASPLFASGQLRGYFGGNPPIEFFKLLAFYIASNTLSSIYWAIPFGPSDIDTMMKQSQDVLSWFDNMKNPIPTWYIEEDREIVELDKEKWEGYELVFEYETCYYFYGQIVGDSNRLSANFVRMEYDEPKRKEFVGTLFPNYFEGSKAYGIFENEKLIACLEVYKEEWTNRLRITEIWVSEDYRRKGLGKKLMDFAKDRAKDFGCRALILETQSCNTKAIDFYLAQGFGFFGFDRNAYSNKDLEKNEVRIEMGLFLED